MWAMPSSKSSILRLLLNEESLLMSWQTSPNYRTKNCLDLHLFTYFRKCSFYWSILDIAIESYQCRGGNASNNCTVLAQIFPPGKIIFLGAFSDAQNQLGFIRNDFEENGVNISKHCPIRKHTSWPGK